ncbi:hypothetical protein QQ045_015063 [Rhodiola kirilowii]
MGTTRRAPYTMDMWHGFSLWLNAGSRIRIKSEAQTLNVENVEVGIIKGEHSYQTLQPNPASDADLKAPSPFYGKESEYTIGMCDTSKATSVCSAVHGSCRLHLAFPSPKYITFSTPNDDYHRESSDYEHEASNISNN